MNTDMTHNSTEFSYFNDVSSHNGDGGGGLDDHAYLRPKYADAFPPLGVVMTGTGGGSNTVPSPDINRRPTVKKMTTSYLKMSNVTQVFSIPAEERKFREASHNFGIGEQGEQSKICLDVMQKTNTHIELTSGKDHTLTVVITGKSDDVVSAKRLLQSSLQTQGSIDIEIPKEYHRFILGRAGAKLRDLELSTGTKITVPRLNELSDTIKVTGPKEGLDNARHELQLISDEQAKLDQKHLSIPKMYHPFICGPYNEIVDELVRTTGVRINIPPLSVQKDEIVVTGDKEKVAVAADQIMAIYKQKKKRCTIVSVEIIKSQHKYVIGQRGSGIQEILAETGVSVEVPPVDVDSVTVTLRGEPDKLGSALTLVYEKANSVIAVDLSAPAWLHRFIIGRKGESINRITQDSPGVHVEFYNDTDLIVLEGPPNEVDSAKRKLQAIVDDLVENMDFVEFDIETKYHRHIIGKNGVNINRVKNEYNVSIRIPQDGTLIRIEGTPDGVVSAQADMVDMVKKMENEKSRDVIIEQRFHRTLIGTGGENIRHIRDKFNNINVAFPEPGKKSDIVTLRGTKDDVDLCYKHLTQLQKDMLENSHTLKMPLFKKLHKNIIGKGGATIRKIRDETGTRIEMPGEDDKSDVIQIIGKKANCEKAYDMINTIANELASIVTEEIDIEQRFHTSIIGAGGRVVRSIMEECGGVHIHFPTEANGSDRVTLRGPKDDVEKAKKQLLELANEKALSSFTEEIQAKPDHHKYLIGRSGATIRKIREQTGARIIFPSLKDEDQETITIIGKKESVEEAKNELLSQIKDLDNVIESEIIIDPKYHRQIMMKRLSGIQDDFPGVRLNFPRNNNESGRIFLKGAAEQVQGAISRLKEVESDLKSQITVEVDIPQKYHGSILGPKGSRVQNIQSDNNVNIKFPDRADSNGFSPPGDQGHNTMNGDIDESSTSSGTEFVERPNRCDIVTVTGKPEDCELAKQALFSYVPITKDVDVSYDLHRHLIGQKGQSVRKMNDEFEVEIAIPPKDDMSNTIRVTGLRENVDRAIIAIHEKVVQLEKDKEDDMLRNFQLTCAVPSKHHSKLIGRRGTAISKLRQVYDVNIQFPDRDKDEIIITGYEKNATAAKEEIERTVKELDEQVVKELTIDQRVHPRLIGQKGRQIKKLMDDFKVDIRIPRQEDQDSNIVVVTGTPSNVEEAEHYLLNMETEYLQDLDEVDALKSYMLPPSKDAVSPGKPRTGGAGFVVRDAPWDQSLDMASTTEFPTISKGSRTSQPQRSAWEKRLYHSDK